MTDAQTSQPAFAGCYRRSVGDIVVTAFNDGYFDLPFAYFAGIDAADAERMLRSAARPAPPRIDVNVFLVEAKGRRILIDTGCGDKLGPTTNRLRQRLSEAQVSPESIDTVLCTHIHPDHTNGLIDAQGHPNFPNAEVIVHGSEVDFWLSDENMNRAPDALRIQFQWARDAFAPYRDRIRPFETGFVAPGIETVALPGHTPGHTGYLIQDGVAQVLIWGDCVHSIAIQAANPNVTFAADVNQDAARETRLKLFDRVATDRLLVTGMHLEFPGFGYLTRAAEAFHYQPEA